jgi:hypothetical protein
MPERLPNMSDMDADELAKTLAHLHLDPNEAAQLLSVAPRTMRRWLVEGEEIPGPAIVAIRAWRAMHDRDMGWKPDTESLIVDDQDQIERFRKHVVDTAAAILRVENRGGPTSQWVIDLSKKSAIGGPFEVNFYQLKADRQVSLSRYRRSDMRPDIERDMPFLEDAVYCIFKAIAKARAAVPALRKVANYTRNHSSVFVTVGPKSLTPTQKAKRQQEIEALADKIDEIASEMAAGRGSYAQFEDILTKLHALGFYPSMTDISEVARALV